VLSISRQTHIKSRDGDKIWICSQQSLQAMFGIVGRSCAYFDGLWNVTYKCYALRHGIETWLVNGVRRAVAKDDQPVRLCRVSVSTECSDPIIQHVPTVLARSCKHRVSIHRKCYILISRLFIIYCLTSWKLWCMYHTEQEWTTLNVR